MLHNMRVLVVGDHFFIISKMNKTSCFKSGHFINIYIINRALHGRLGIRSPGQSFTEAVIRCVSQRCFAKQRQETSIIIWRSSKFITITNSRSLGIGYLPLLKTESLHNAIREF